MGCLGYPTCNATLSFTDALIKHNIENEITSDEEQFETDDWEF